MNFTNEQQLSLFSDDVMDQLKVDLKIDDSDFDGFPTNSPNSVNCSLLAFSFLNN